MRQITIFQSAFDEPHGQFVDRVVARLSVDDGVAQVRAGSDEWLSIPVLDPATGNQLTSSSDPEHWADLLPTALRSGDVFARIETFPVETARDEVEDELADAAGTTHLPVTARA